MPLYKVLIFTGLSFVVIGLVLSALTKLDLPFGKLFGDINIQKEKYSIHLYLGTSLIISLILTIILNFFWFIRK
jgi:hypothetical protein